MGAGLGVCFCADGCVAGKENFFKALDRTNPDFPRNYLDILANELFPAEFEGRTINFESFMKIFLKQDVHAIKRFCVHN